MIDTTAIGSIIGAPVNDKDGDKIGSAEQVYVDGDSGTPTWVTVRTGLFGTKETFVPLEGASWVTVRTGLFGTKETFVPLEGASWDREVLHVSYDKATVKDAPRVDADGALSADEESELYRHYGIGGYSDTTDTTTGTDTFVDTDTSGTRGTVGHDTSGPTTDDAMTRSEEQLHVGTEKVRTGSARLRKYIVSEQETVTVPVTHEEVRLEREPITEANAGQALAGPDLSEEEHEVILSEDRVVVEKEAVPVERVRLDKETVTEQRRVTEEVRHEEIELEDGTTGRNTTGRNTDGL